MEGLESPRFPRGSGQAGKIKQPSGSKQPNANVAIIDRFCAQLPNVDIMFFLTLERYFIDLEHQGKICCAPGRSGTAGSPKQCAKAEDANPGGLLTKPLPLGRYQQNIDI